MKKILPSFDDHLSLTIFKILALIATAIVLVAIGVLLPAGGHPPGIALVPIAAGIWILVMIVMTITYYSLKYFAKKNESISKPNMHYTYSIVLAGVYFMYLFIDSIYSLMPYALYTVPGISLYKILTLLITYIVLVGTVVRKKWARILTVILLILPMILILYSLWIAGGRIGGFSFGLVMFLVTTVLSIWVVYEYMTNEKVKLYFSR